jgi:spoIIIJ-associated protein
MRINLDVGDYRARREETLRSLAQRAARKVEESGRRLALDAMNAAERRIVHQELQSFGGVTTQSEGQEPYRRVVILPK